MKYPQFDDETSDEYALRLASYALDEAKRKVISTERSGTQRIMRKLQIAQDAIAWEYYTTYWVKGAAHRAKERRGYRDAPRLDPARAARYKEDDDTDA